MLITTSEITNITTKAMPLITVFFKPTLVYFEQTIQNMIKDGVDTFVEIGPGKTLTGFVRKIDRKVNVFTINTMEDVERMLQTWNK